MKYLSYKVNSFIFLSSLFFLNNQGIAGFYGGVDLGYNKVNTTLTSRAHLPILGAGSASSKLTSANLSAGVLAGLEKEFENSFMALEGFASNENDRISEGHPKKQTIRTTDPFDLVSFRFNLKMKHTFGLGVILGVKTNVGLRPFFRLDALNSKFSLKIEDLLDNGSVASVVKKSKNLWAIAPGVGTDYDFTPVFSGRIAYKVNFYQKYKSRALFLGHDFPHEHNFRAVVHNVRIGLIYKFKGNDQ